MIAGLTGDEDPAGAAGDRSEVVPAPAPPGRVSPTSKGLGAAAADAERRRLLQLLAREVGVLREAAARVRAEVRALQEVSHTRRLSPAEARRASALRRESEAHRLQLKQYAAEFERLRARGSGGGRRTEDP